MTPAGVALLGMPPSGAYLAKELLLQAAVETQQWWWAGAIQAGGIFTAGYVLLVLAHAIAPTDEPATLRFRGSRTVEGVALALALCSLLLGLFPWQDYLSVAPGTGATPLVLAPLASTLWLVFGGAALAVLVGRWDDRIARISFGRIVAASRQPVIKEGTVIWAVIVLMSVVGLAWVKVRRRRKSGDLAATR